MRITRCATRSATQAPPPISRKPCCSGPRPRHARSCCGTSSSTWHARSTTARPPDAPSTTSRPVLMYGALLHGRPSTSRPTAIRVQRSRSATTSRTSSIRPRSTCNLPSPSRSIPEARASPGADEAHRARVPLRLDVVRAPALLAAALCDAQRLRPEAAHHPAPDRVEEGNPGSRGQEHLVGIKRQRMRGEALALALRSPGRVFTHLRYVLAVDGRERAQRLAGLHLALQDDGTSHH